MSKENKKPDNIVWNEETNEYDASKLSYPTTVGSQSFEPLVIDNTIQKKASKYFKSRMGEIIDDYNKLMEEYKWNKLVYESKYSFEPVVGEIYHLYVKNDGEYFLSIIEPHQWKQKHIGSFKLLNNGKWEKV